MSGEFIIFVGNFKTMKIMKKYICTVCSYIYDPEDWVCPLCGVGKEDFEPVEE